MGRPYSGGQGGDRRPRRDYRQSYNRRKVCQFCVDKVSYIDYKDVNRLRRFLNDRARIDPRRSTGTCAKHQRRLSTAIKRARSLALLPYTPEQLKALGFARSEGPRRTGDGYRGRYQRSEGSGGGYRGEGSGGGYRGEGSGGGYRGGGYRSSAPQSQAPAPPPPAAGAPEASPSTPSTTDISSDSSP